MKRHVLVGLLSAAALLCVAGGCTRVLETASGTRSMPPAQLGRELAGAEPPLVLDVREPQDYEAGHIAGARSVPLHGIDGFFARHAVPPDRAVVVVCYSGRLSTLGAAAAAAWHRGPVRGLAGGMTAWISEGLPLERGPGEPAGDASRPTKSVSPFGQFLATSTAVAVKPFYMLLCLALIVVLRHARSTPLRLLFWGLVCFDAGEAFCALDLFFADRTRPIAPLDLLHGAGMVGMGVLAPWGLLRLADERVLRFGAAGQACAIQRFCGRCWKNQPVSCGLHRLFLFLLPALALLSLIPLSASPRPIHYQSRIYLNVIPYGAPIVNEWVEISAYSLVGALFFAAAWLVLRTRGPGGTRRAELPFFIGIGFASFALFRFVLHGAFRDAVHVSDAWEEITETIAIGAIAMLLFVFRTQLDLVPPRHTPAPAPSEG